MIKTETPSQISCSHSQTMLEQLSFVDYCSFCCCF